MNIARRKKNCRRSSVHWAFVGVEAVEGSRLRGESTLLDFKQSEAWIGRSRATLHSKIRPKNVLRTSHQDMVLFQRLLVNLDSTPQNVFCSPGQIPSPSRQPNTNLHRRTQTTLTSVNTRKNSISSSRAQIRNEVRPKKLSKFPSGDRLKESSHS
jgi:hypothetical protein